MDEAPPVSHALDELGVPHRIFRHSGSVRSLEQAAQERGHRPEQVVRSILFRLDENEFLMALVAGPAQISWKALRQYLNRSRISMASPEEVLEVTGYPIGAVSPFGLPGPLRILVDTSLFAEDELSIGSGVRGVAVILQKDDLLRALGEVETVDLLAA
jgi:Cys-tRNA(Pro)/Cys-tRNA(Cys) deacylase